MNENILYPSLLIISGVLLSTLVIIILTRFSSRIIKLFELYPESRGILNVSFKFISWFIGLILFLIFSRWAFRMWGLEFTTKLIEDVIRVSPKYILALLIILCGFYISRIIRERSKEYDFEYKDRIILILDFIVHMTFVFTAFYSIGINITFFLEFYRVVLWVIGAIIVLIISMIIGIPLGMSVYKKAQKEKRLHKERK